MTQTYRKRHGKWRKTSVKKDGKVSGILKIAHIVSGFKIEFFPLRPVKNGMKRRRGYFQLFAGGKKYFERLHSQWRKGARRPYYGAGELSYPF